jgi:hypothetical protein
MFPGIYLRTNILVTNANEFNRIISRVILVKNSTYSKQQQIKIEMLLLSNCAFKSCDLDHINTYTQAQ